MTVIFGQPTTGQPFGFGVKFSVRSDLVGPVLGPSWLCSLSLTSGVHGNFQTNFVPANFNVFEANTYMAGTTGPLVLPDLLPSYLAASSGFLFAQLLDNTFSVVESGQVAVSITWLGLPVLLSQQLARGIVGGTGMSEILAAVKHSYTC
jgi:hypothetical protein